MPILNYTTEIATDKTIGEIQKCLASHGASAILAEYDDEGMIASISFQIVLDDQKIGFRLPSDWRPVLKILEQSPKVPRRLCTKEQAIRVSWRIIKTWIEAQMAIVETKMVKMDQVFLPYAVAANGKTLYEHVKASNLLTAPPNPNV
jgi:hypothetical protein